MMSSAASSRHIRDPRPMTNRPLACASFATVVIGPARFDRPSRSISAAGPTSTLPPATSSVRIEDGVGEDLSWFWHSWFYTRRTLDQAVDSVASDSAGTASRIYLRNVGAMPMPVDLAR